MRVRVRFAACEHGADAPEGEGLQPLLPTVAAFTPYGCSLYYHGCSLYYLRLPPASMAPMPQKEKGLRSSCASSMIVESHGCSAGCTAGCAAGCSAGCAVGCAAGCCAGCACSLRSSLVASVHRAAGSVLPNRLRPTLLRVRLRLRIRGRGRATVAAHLAPLVGLVRLARVRVGVRARVRVGIGGGFEVRVGVRVRVRG